MSSLGLDIKKAVKIHNDRLNHDKYQVDDFVNLILIYWNISFDYGFESYCITQKIFTKEQILSFPKKVERLFKIAFEKYPNNKSLIFWNMYIKELSSFSECLYKKEMLKLLKGDEFLLPYFYLKIQCGDSNPQAIKELKGQLLEEDNNSYEKYYVLSYLEDVILS